MFKVKRFRDAPQEARAAQNLELRVEIGRVVDGVINDRTFLRDATEGRIVFQINLHARLCFINIRFARHVNRRQHGDEQGHANNQPDALTHRAPVILKMHPVIFNIAWTVTVACYRRCD